MKRCKTITAWTDYPFTELGDAAGKPAPIRHVRVTGYDQNKYATVELLGFDVVSSVKCGYLYQKPGRCGTVKTINRRKLERMVTKHNAAIARATGEAK